MAGVTVMYKTFFLQLNIPDLIAKFVPAHQLWLDGAAGASSRTAHWSCREKL